MRCDLLLEQIQNADIEGYDAGHPLHLMEICGTHTMSIARSGLKQLLPDWIRLISGPGCPVCVTPAGAIDEILRIAGQKDVIITTYGDLIRVPGSRPGSSLAGKMAEGADVRMVYSPIDALEIARKEADKQVVFLGVGFETTAPGTAAAILSAKEAGCTNFSILCLLKQTEPAIRSLLADYQNQIDGLICPGHVASILGSEAFSFLPAEYGLPAVAAGFETEDLVLAVHHLVMMCRDKQPGLVNEYQRCVRPGGNPVAREVMAKVFEPSADLWRGLGAIPESGYRIREEFAAFDAAKRFGFAPEDIDSHSGCRCGEILCGRLSPSGCPLFGRRCTPSDPVGPCMVSGEGACAAEYLLNGGEF